MVLKAWRALTTALVPLATPLSGFLVDLFARRRPSRSPLARARGAILFSHEGERSIMHAPESASRYPAFVVAGRRRQATCSDVAWFKDGYLAAVNLYGQHLRIYRVLERSGVPAGLELVHERGEVASPEGVAVSPDGLRLAVSHSLSNDFGITLYAIDPLTRAPGPPERIRQGRDRCAFHGVAFAPDGRHLAHTVIGETPSIEIIRLDTLETVCRLEPLPRPLTPKSVAFTGDGKFLAIPHGLIAGQTDRGDEGGGMLTVHRFDLASGRVQAEPVARYRAAGAEIGFIDMITIMPETVDGAWRILLADQGGDRIVAFSFDVDGLTLQPLGAFAEGLPFPHGVAASPDGRYVALSTYGDDRIHIATPPPTVRRTVVPGTRAAKRRLAVIGHAAGPSLGGAERSLLELLAAVDRDLFDVSCVLPSEGGAYRQAVERLCDRLIVTSYGWTAASHCPPQAVQDFEDLFRREGFDLVHVNTLTLAAPLVAARRLGIPSIVHVRELIDEDPELAALLGSAAADIVEGVRALATFVVANSNATLRVVGVEGRSSRLYNAVDIDRLDIPNRPAPGILRVGLISTFHTPRKGMEDFGRLARAARALRPELEFHFIGHPNRDAEEARRATVPESGAPDLSFDGYVDDALDAVSSVNVIASLPVVPESFGRTLAEGLAARRPVLAWDHGAAPELIRDGIDGFLVPRGDIETAARRLCRLVDEPGLVARMGASGRERAEQMFAPPFFAEELRRIHRRTLALAQSDPGVDPRA